MQLKINKHSNLVRIIVALILFALVFVLSGFTNSGILKTYFPYLSCLMFVLVTWFLFRIENRSLESIGLTFKFQHLRFLILGTLLGICVLLLAKYLRCLYLGESLKLSSKVDMSDVFLAFYFILPQVATEELLFRGYLFHKTIRITNVVAANIIFSVIFTLVHVLDEGVIQNRGMMIMLLISIPVGHLMFATALIKSKTLWFPIGLHLGNNWSTRHMVSSENLGNSFFYIEGASNFETWAPFITVLIITNGCFLMLTLLIWKWASIVRICKSLSK